MSQALNLGPLSAIRDPGSKAYDVGSAAGGFQVFIIRKGPLLKAYLNSCPHTRGPLDWTPDQFWSEDHQHIQCSQHMALFRPEDGQCLAGPCRGQQLTAVPCKLEENTDQPNITILLPV